ncbi:hypothetical protein [Flavimaricola marinus]|uniref:Uncharacterized protein n=1 Tax=Flavimaricola marinus TaxID=1819565 RepID=A0A238LJE5_9RHOB|nr:hypothetical protein [Flavimaricola marinus]SMY09663.1 hypothetical protein LOM8899_03835 [Flavimaricola marinus]
MIFPLTGLLLGAILGVLRARKRGGTTADILQWAVVHALVLGLLGLFVLVIIERNLV